MAWNPENLPKFTGLKLTKYGPFTESIEFDFDPEVNVFIGPNATGKSTILKALDWCSPRQGEQRIFIWDGDWILKEGDPLFGTVPVVYLPPVREVLPRFDETNINRWTYTPIRESDEYREEEDVALRYGELEPLEPTPVMACVSEIQKAQRDWRNLVRRTEGPHYRRVPEVLGHNHDLTSFDAAQVYRALQELLVGGRRNDRLQAARVIMVARACIQDIGTEVLQGGPANFFDRSQTYDGDFAFVSPAKEYIGMGSKVVGGGGEPLYLGNLSTGIQGLFGWIYYLSLQMAEHYSFSEESADSGRSYRWHDQPSILLIDEIENHLHPTWQRRVIPALRKHFPGLQIFATTHSPFVVAGLKRGQVHLLKRDASGIVTASTNERDVIGWTADEILRTMMGVEEPTDQLTVYRAERLRQLRGKEVLTPEEEIELNELRRQVNEDLLAKRGPLEAQEERFDKLMRDFLLSRQSDLAQEGG